MTRILCAGSWDLSSTIAVIALAALSSWGTWTGLGIARRLHHETDPRFPTTRPARLFLVCILLGGGLVMLSACVLAALSPWICE